MDSGAPFVKMAGISQMHQLCVECWDTRGPGQPVVVLNIPGALVRSG